MPMIYDIKLRMTHSYQSPAVGGRHVACIAPLDTAVGQTVFSSVVQIDPPPHERVDWRDFFGNQMVEFGFRGPHSSVKLSLQSRVARDVVQPDLGTSVAMGDLREDLLQICDVSARSPLHFLSPSRRVPRNADMTRFALDAITPEMTAARAAVAVGSALHRHMKFDADATTVNTPAEEAFANGRGVCQDYSHIMIACLRGIGIPAGYVSGFLRTMPPPGKARLEGADAMHAWVAIWAGSTCGWIEFDPTNDCLVGNDHIVVARGRDYSDVAPIKGSMRISGRQTSHQSVDVIPLETAVDTGSGS